MTKLNLFSLLLLTKLLLVGCSNSYGSKEEARNAKNEWLKDGVTIQIYEVGGYGSPYAFPSSIEKTRWYDEEKETLQFVCKKRLESSQKMSEHEWGKAKAKIHYTYFRY